MKKKTFKRAELIKKLEGFGLTDINLTYTKIDGWWLSCNKLDDWLAMDSYGAMMRIEKVFNKTEESAKDEPLEYSNPLSKKVVDDFAKSCEQLEEKFKKFTNEDVECFRNNLIDAFSKVVPRKYLDLTANNSLPFSEYYKFHKWMKDEGWYEAAEMEYDNSNNPSSCFRLTIAELYDKFKNKNEKTILI